MSLIRSIAGFDGECELGRPEGRERGMSLVSCGRFRMEGIVCRVEFCSW